MLGLLDNVTVLVLLGDNDELRDRIQPDVTLVDEYGPSEGGSLPQVPSEDGDSLDPVDRTHEDALLRHLHHQASGMPRPV